MKTCVGVDAGGSSTIAAASRSGVALGTASSGPANVSVSGIAVASERIAEAVRAVAGEAEELAVFVGAAGAGRAAIAEGLRVALQTCLPKAGIVRVADDTTIALRAAIPEGPGIVLIAGTGSVAYAENGERHVRVGGAGYLLGDEGSGFAIGVSALRLTLQVEEGRARADALTYAVREAFESNDRDSLLAAVYGAVPPDIARIAALAPIVLAQAGEGCRSAVKIVQTAARELGDLVQAAARGAELLERAPFIAFQGGLLQENSLLTYVLQTRLQGDIAGAVIVRDGEEPVRAALRLAETAA